MIDTSKNVSIFVQKIAQLYYIHGIPPLKLPFVNEHSTSKAIFYFQK